MAVQMSEIKELSREKLESFAYDMAREQDTLHALLKLIPPCPEHGRLCSSHAAAWLKENVQKDS